jgi:hypothetical protein
MSILKQYVILLLVKYLDIVLITKNNILMVKRVLNNNIYD